MGASTDLALPVSGYRPDLWYFLAAAQVTTNYPAKADYNRVFQAAGPFSLITVTPEPLLDDDGGESGNVTPLFRVAIYEKWILVVVQPAQTTAQLSAITKLETQVAWNSTDERVSLLVYSIATHLFSLMSGFITNNIAGRKIVVCGHSWGGMVGQMLGRLLKATWPDSFDRVLAYGSPKVGNGAFADACRDVVVNVYNVQDLTTFWPPAYTTICPFAPLPAQFATLKEWRHAGRIWTLDLDGVPSIRDLFPETPELERNAFADGSVFNSPSDVAYHGWTSYLGRFRANLPPDTTEIAKRFGWFNFDVIDDVMKQIAHDDGR